MHSRMDLDPVAVTGVFCCKCLISVTDDTGVCSVVLGCFPVRPVCAGCIQVLAAKASLELCSAQGKADYSEFHISMYK
jgi:hypothetical protein